LHQQFNLEQIVHARESVEREKFDYRKFEKINGLKMLRSVATVARII
jgi:hypothetical protein